MLVEKIQGKEDNIKIPQVDFAFDKKFLLKDTETFFSKVKYYFLLAIKTLMVIIFSPLIMISYLFKKSVVKKIFRKLTFIVYIILLIVVFLLILKKISLLQDIKSENKIITIDFYDKIKDFE